MVLSILKFLHFVAISMDLHCVSVLHSYKTNFFFFLPRLFERACPNGVWKLTFLIFFFLRYRHFGLFHVVLFYFIRTHCKPPFSLRIPLAMKEIEKWKTSRGVRSRKYLMVEVKTTRVPVFLFSKRCTQGRRWRVPWDSYIHIGHSESPVNHDPTSCTSPLNHRLN